MNSTILGDAVKGAVAGAVATWAMDHAVRLLGHDEANGTAPAEKGSEAGGGGAPEDAQPAGRADAGDGVAGRAVRPKSPPGLHWGIGMSAGAVYAILRRRLPLVGGGQGAGFGSTFFLLVDEGITAVSGFSPPSASVPWRAQARGIAGHVIFGLVADTTLDLLDRVS